MGIKSNNSSELYYNYFAASSHDAGNPPPPPPIIWYGARGVVAGGHKGGQGNLSRIDYFAIASAGNASSFGSLTAARGYLAGVTNASRGCFGGGYDNGVTIDYITISSTGNATDFGDLTVGAESLLELMMILVGFLLVKHLHLVMLFSI